MEYIEEFKQLFNELRTNKIFYIEYEKELYEDCTIEEAHQVYEILIEMNEFSKLGNQFENFFRLTNKLASRYICDGLHGGGEFNFSNLFLILELIDYDEKLYFDGQTAEEKALWKTFKVFDSHPETGDGKMAAFSTQKGLVVDPDGPDIYFIDRSEAYKMSIKYGEYLDVTLDLMAIFNWQYLFCETEGKQMVVNLKKVLKELLDDINYLEKTYPEKDLSKYRDLASEKLKSL